MYRFLKFGAKVLLFFDMCKFFCIFFYFLLFFITFAGQCAAGRWGNPAAGVAPHRRDPTDSMRRGSWRGRWEGLAWWGGLGVVYGLLLARLWDGFSVVMGWCLRDYGLIIMRGLFDGCRTIV